MISKRLVLLGVGIAYAIVLQGEARAAPNQIQQKLDEKFFDARQLYSNEVIWEEEILYWLAVEKLPGGILIDGPFLRTGRMPKKDRSGISAQELLEAMRLNNPGYEWKTTQGVLNILPKNLKKHHLIRFATTVSSFSVHVASPQLAIRDLLIQFQIPAELHIVGPIRSPKPSREFRCSKLTILQCINQFVKQDGDGFWYIRYNPSVKRFSVESSGSAIFRDSGEE
jgi:hypothetical protein